MKKTRFAIAVVLCVSLLGLGSTAASAASQVVKIAATSAGKVIVAANGRTLYVFAADSPGTSTCTGSCAQAWPPVLVTSRSLGHSSDVKAKLSTITRSDGKTQLAINGLPVYTFSGDSAAGQDHGQGLNSSGGLWWVIGPNGTPIKAAATSGSGSTSGGSGGSGGSYDYY